VTADGKYALFVTDYELLEEELPSIVTSVTFPISEDA